jgi:uncharacterized protein (UPF0276 family)
VAPTLIEWDNDLPSFAVLAAEAERARAVAASAGLVITASAA